MKTQMTGDEHLVFDGMPVGYTLRDFWAWNSSNLLDNTARGHFCEFLVASALGIDLSGTNEDWLPYDLLFINESKNIRIEVKSAAYLQAWERSKLSGIHFTIRPTRAWDPENGYSDTLIRQSDIYIFCLYTETNRELADPLQLDGWDFYVLPTYVLDDQCGAQKTISFSRLLDLKPIKADYSTVRSAVEALT